MWKISDELRNAIMRAAPEDGTTDLPAYLSLRFLLAADVAWETACAMQRKCLDFDTGLLQWVHPSSGQKRQKDLPLDLTAALAPMSSTPEDFLIPFMQEAGSGQRLRALTLALGQPLGLVAPPQYVEMPSHADKVARPGMTKRCLDPWINLEITSDGGTRACCKAPHVKDQDGSSRSYLNDMTSERRKKTQDELLSGNLSDLCASCSIRKDVPLDVLRRDVANLPSTQIAIPKTLRIELTTNCNLRCTYCAVTSPYYQGADLPQDLFPSILEVTRLMPKGSHINVNGHGETTFHPRWMDLCRPIINQGMRPAIISNLAKSYTEEEIKLLSHFGQIEVSLDSHDPVMMRKIRKAVTPDRILANINRIREASEGKPPFFNVSAGLYDPSIWTLPNFAHWIVDAKIRHVTFWNLVPYSHSKLTVPLLWLSGPELERARENIAAARVILDEARIRYEFAGDFAASDGGSLVDPVVPVRLT